MTLEPNLSEMIRDAVDYLRWLPRRRPAAPPAAAPAPTVPVRPRRQLPAATPDELQAAVRRAYTAAYALAPAAIAGRMGRATFVNSVNAAAREGATLPYRRGIADVGNAAHAAAGEALRDGLDEEGISRAVMAAALAAAGAAAAPVPSPESLPIHGPGAWPGLL